MPIFESIRSRLSCSFQISKILAVVTSIDTPQNGHVSCRPCESSTIPWSRERRASLSHPSHLESSAFTPVMLPLRRSRALVCKTRIVGEGVIHPAGEGLDTDAKDFAQGKSQEAAVWQVDMNGASSWMRVLAVVPAAPGSDREFSARRRSLPNVIRVRCPPSFEG